jgi:outer membrane protein TolC
MKNTKTLAIVCIAIYSIGYQVNAQSLDSLLHLVVENNTELRAIDLEYKSILEKRDQVSQLPSPQVGLGVPVLRPETRLGPQVMMIGASQMFPWFGTLKSKEDVIVSMSKAKFEQISILKLELFYQVKSAYYQLYFLDQKKSVILENQRIYQSLESIALAKLEAGQTSLSDALRLQSKLQGFAQQLLVIENQKISFESKINELTKRPIDQKIQLVDSVVWPILAYDLELFKNQIQLNHPIMAQIDYQIEASKNMLLESSNMNKPTIGIGLDYSIVGKRTDANPTNNGRDILIPKLMVNIPLYRKSYKAKINEENFLQESLAVKKENLTDKMLGMLVRYKAEYDIGQLEKTLYESQTTTMGAAYDVILSAYISSGKGFEELLLVQNQLQEFQLGIYQSELKMNEAQANIERLTNY